MIPEAEHEVVPLVVLRLSYRTHGIMVAVYETLAEVEDLVPVLVQLDMQHPCHRRYPVHQKDRVCCYGNCFIDFSGMLVS